MKCTAADALLFSLWQLTSSFIASFTDEIPKKWIDVVTKNTFHKQ